MCSHKFVVQPEHVQVVKMESMQILAAIVFFSNLMQVFLWTVK